MILSDRDINRRLDAGNLVITPLDRNDIQPASVDISLHPRILVFERPLVPYIDPRHAADSRLTSPWEPQDDSPFMLHPGEFILGSTLEHIEIPNDLVARIEGKSSLGRMGLLIHSTAGYVDPGWRGRLTLELSNIARIPIALYPNMKIGQMSFATLSTPADRPYGSPGLGSHYQDQTEATPSRMSESDEPENTVPPEESPNQQHDGEENHP